MMMAYNQKKIFRDLEEDEFLAKIAKVMNSSPEQLKNTYIGIDRSEFEQTAKELISVLDGDAEGRDGGCNAEEKDKDVYDSLFG